jgi:hypothetical protein
MSGINTNNNSPYRISAKVERDLQDPAPSLFERFVEWWKDEEHYIPVIIFGTLGFAIFLLILIGAYERAKDQAIDRAIINYGIAACKQDHYAETKYPAVGLKKIICLSANGEEKYIFEETNK